jgi:hypothetical protein
MCDLAKLFTYPHIILTSNILNEYHHVDCHYTECQYAKCQGKFLRLGFVSGDFAEARENVKTLKR